MKPKLIRILLLIGAPLVAFAICAYYMSIIPRFDIGFNESFISLACMVFTFIITAIAVTVLYKLTKPGKNNTKLIFLLIAIYWLIIWGFCYYKCVIEAAHELQMMLNGDVG